MLIITLGRSIIGLESVGKYLSDMEISAKGSAFIIIKNYFDTQFGVEDVQIYTYFCNPRTMALDSASRGAIFICYLLVTMQFGLWVFIPICAYMPYY